MLPNQIEIVKRLSELSKILDRATDDIAVADEAAVLAKQAFEVAYARAFINCEGSVDHRKHEATIRTQAERLEYELAFQKHRAVRERINTIRSQLSIGQTLSAAIRSQFLAEPVGQDT
jgi:hypothetical protein